MGLCHLQHGWTKGWQMQPPGHLVAQSTDALRDRATIVSSLAFAGDDKHQPQALGVSVQDEAG
jgi:hypothetical protein